MLTGKLWDILCGYFGESWSCHKGQLCIARFCLQNSLIDCMDTSCLHYIFWYQPEPTIWLGNDNQKTGKSMYIFGVPSKNIAVYAIWQQAAIRTKFMKICNGLSVRNWDIQWVRRHWISTLHFIAKTIVNNMIFSYVWLLVCHNY